VKAANRTKVDKRTEPAVKDGNGFLSLEWIERAPQNSARYWLTALDSISDGVALVDADGNIIHCNKPMLSILGLTLEDALGTDCLRSMLPDNGGTDSNPAARMKNTLHRESAVVNTDRHWYDIACSPLLDRDGNLTGAVYTISDITEEKENQSALRASEEKYRALTYNVNAGIYRSDASEEGRFVEANPALVRMFGFHGKEEFLKVKVSDLYQDPNDRDRFYRKMLRDGFVKDEQLRLRKKDGAPMWASVTAVAAYDEQGNVKHYDGVVEDITEKKRAELEIEELAKFPDENPNPVMKIGISGTLLYANKASASILEDWGTKVGKLLPKKWRDFVLATFDAGSPSETEICCQGRVVSLTVAPVMTANYANLYGLDITERKQADEVKSVALRISQATNTSSDLHELLETINDELSTLIDTSNFYVALYDPENGLYNFPFFVDERMKAEEFTPQDLTGSLTDYVRRSGKPLFADEETQQELRDAGEAKMVGAPSPIWLGAPLETPGGVIGVVAVQSYTDRGHYSMRDLELMSLASGNIAMAIERKRGEDALQESYRKLEKAMRGTIDAMARTAETRDPYTAGHQKRVAILSQAIARKMQLPEDKVSAIHMAAMIHDLGKINVPAEILSKPGGLTELEVDLIRIHPKVGYEILKEIDFPWPIAEIVLQHHERLDGSGYPQGKSGDDVLLEARILGVADVVEAISSHRPYRSALGLDRALEEITKNRGTLYDAKVVDACVKILTVDQSELDW
jgi:PAS domain S-box-containing protein/putative nucleotidyltransferase with HDIG domain